jgi:hypothetical protein
MISENEASQKWCPEARVPRLINIAEGVEEAVAANRNPGSRNPFEGARCVGSECMHWCWTEGRGPTKKGYCGLSGKA